MLFDTAGGIASFVIAVFSSFFGLVYVVPALAGVFGIYIDRRAKSIYKRYSWNESRIHLTGFYTADKILSRNGITQIRIQSDSKEFEDNFNESQQVIHLSEEVYNGNNLSAIAISAHEAFHAVQCSTHDRAFVARSKLFPISNFCSPIVIPVAIIGFFTCIKELTALAMILLVMSALFSVITIPVEYNASRMAYNYLDERGILKDQDLNAAKKILKSALMTYIAGLLMSMIDIVRVFGIQDLK